jgi:CelD/BcsL family acetyltransferase involved in cellulose biosynthesis
MTGGCVCVAGDDPRWLAFLEARPEATIFHHPAWSVMVAACYGFEPFVLCSFDEAGGIEAGLPVMEVTTVRRTRWVALPYADAVPPLVAPDRAVAFGLAVERARVAAGGRSLEVHGELRSGTLGDRGVMHSLDLRRGPDALRKSLSTQTRRMIARAAREGVSTSVRRDRGALLDVFYGLHLETRRRQGVPIQPRRFFGHLWRHLLEPGLGDVAIAEIDGTPVAAVVVLRFGRTVTYKFGASDDLARETGANHALLWAAIETAASAGFSVFDFGRTDLGHDGLRRFKAGFGAVEVPLRHTWLGTAPGDDPGRARALLAAAIRISPRWVCRAAGSALYRYVA